TGADEGGTGSGSGSALTAAEATSGTAADADGAAIDVAGFAEATGMADTTGTADTADLGDTTGLDDAAGAADTGAALGALWARASGMPNAPKISANAAKKASRSPQTRASTHEYDEDLTRG
ncbi:MAG TPA: hypothetical protein VF294_07585, partial [Polyangiaceae bacterium]